MAGGKKGNWVQRSEGEWRALLSRFARSGLGVGAFCQRESISTASFYRWRALLGKGDAGGDETRRDPGPVFVDVGALHSVSASRPRLDLRLDLGDGLILHLVRGRCSFPKARCAYMSMASRSTCANRMMDSTL